ncbi:MAG: NACHT domain-containing protein [Nannocystaceae bacterium]
MGQGIQLSCDQGGYGSLQRASGSAIVVDQHAVALITWHPEKLLGSVIFARSLDVIAERFPCLQVPPISRLRENSPPREAALTEYRNTMVRRGSFLQLGVLHESLGEVEIEPSTRQVLVCRTSAREEPLWWAQRRLGRCILKGAPGSGKSTALRRLAAQLAANTDEPLPLFVHLPTLVGRLEEQDNALEVLVTSGLKSLSSAIRPIVQAEMLERFRRNGQAVLLLDSLDECRSDRLRVVDLILSALEELHHDVEAVLATRDTGYASAYRLCWGDIGLLAPRDLNESLQRAAVKLAEILAVPKEMHDEWVADRMNTLEDYRAKNAGIQENPLLSMGLLVLLADNRIGNEPLSTAQVLSALVDRVVSRWEVESRRRGKIELGALSGGEAVETLKFVFDEVGHRLLSPRGVTRTVLAESISVYVSELWGLAKGRGAHATMEALHFWDEAGVFCATGGAETVTASARWFVDIADARRMARVENVPQKQDWLTGRIADEIDGESVVLACGLDSILMRLLADSAIESGDLRLAELVSRALQSGAELHHTHRVEFFGRLVDMLGESEDISWTCVNLLLPHSFSPEFADELCSAFESKIAPEWGEAAALLGRLRWLPTAPLTLVGLQRFLESARTPAATGIGPNKHRAEMYDKVAMEAALVIPVERTDLADKLTECTGLSVKGHIRMLQNLTRTGHRSSKLREFAGGIGQKLPTVVASAFSIARRRPLFLGALAGLATPSTSYRALRRMREIVVFVRTIIPPNTGAGGVFEFERRPNELREFVEMISDLGGFHRPVLAAQASRIEALAGTEWDDSMLLFEECDPAPLSHWPEPGADQDSMLGDALRIALSGRWPAGVLAEAFQQHPSAAYVMTYLLRNLPRHKASRPRLIIARAALTRDDRRGEIAVEWIRSGEPDLARVGAEVLADLCIRKKYSLSALRTAMVDADEATVRGAIIRLREYAEDDHELQALVDVLSAMPKCPWTCLDCGCKNETGRSSCSNCHILLSIQAMR